MAGEVAASSKRHLIQALKEKVHLRKKAWERQANDFNDLQEIFKEADDKGCLSYVQLQADPNSRLEPAASEGAERQEAPVAAPPAPASSSQEANAPPEREEDSSSSLRRRWQSLKAVSTRREPFMEAPALPPPRRRPSSGALSRGGTGDSSVPPSARSNDSGKLTFCTADSGSPTRSTRSPSPDDRCSTDRSWEQLPAGNRLQEDVPLLRVPPPKRSVSLPSSAHSSLPVDEPNPEGDAAIPPLRPPPRPSTGGTPAPRPSLKAKAPPPPPKSKAKAPSEEGPTTKLVRLDWRSSLEPHDNEVNASADGYVSRVFSFLEGSRERFHRSQSRLKVYDAAVTAGTESQSQQDAVEATLNVDAPRASIVEVAGSPPNAIARRRRYRRNTVFTGECSVGELSQSALMELFQTRTSSLNLGRRGSAGAGLRGLITNVKHLEIVDILLKKEAILRHKDLPKKEREDRVVGELVRALQQCDYGVITPEMLDDLRKVTSTHLAQTQGQTVLSFVSMHGQESLQVLEYPHIHQLVYRMLQIPGIVGRLECMAIEATFTEHAAHCRKNLEVLADGLRCAVQRLEPLRRLFSLVIHVGNALNKGNPSAAKTTYGFKLCTLSMLSHLKLPRRKELTLLHFIVFWMRKQDIEALLEPESAAVLRQARQARHYTVYQDCLRLLGGFRKIQAFLTTGVFNGIKIEKCNMKDDDAGVGKENQNENSKRNSVDTATNDDIKKSDDDVFFTRMQEFVKKCGRQAHELWTFSVDIFKSYRKLSEFFDDCKLTWPPPLDQKDDKKDLLDVIDDFLMNMGAVWRQICAQSIDREVEEQYQVQLPCNSGEPFTGPVTLHALPSQVAVPEASPAVAEGPVAMTTPAPNTTTAPKTTPAPKHTPNPKSTALPKSAFVSKITPPPPKIQLPQVPSAGPPGEPLLGETVTTPPASSIRTPPNKSGEAVDPVVFQMTPSARTGLSTGTDGQTDSPVDGDVSQVAVQFSLTPAAADRTESPLGSEELSGQTQHINTNGSPERESKSMVSTPPAVVPPLALDVIGPAPPARRVEAPSTPLAPPPARRVMARVPSRKQVRQLGEELSQSMPNLVCGAPPIFTPPSTPTGSSTPRVHMAPPSPKASRKSLIINADRYEEQGLRSIGYFREEPDCGYCTPYQDSGAGSPEDCLSPLGSEDSYLISPTPGLQAQLAFKINELKHRRSKGRPGLLFDMPSTMPSPPSTPRPKAFPLTPIKEALQEETPHRASSGRRALGAAS